MIYTTITISRNRPSFWSAARDNECLPTAPGVSKRKTPLIGGQVRNDCRRLLFLLFFFY